jgi:hypothetical protein
MDWPLHSFMQPRIRREKTGGMKTTALASPACQIYPHQIIIEYVCTLYSLYSIWARIAIFERMIYTAPCVML